MPSFSNISLLSVICVCQGAAFPQAPCQQLESYMSWFLNIFIWGEITYFYQLLNESCLEVSCYIYSLKFVISDFVYHKVMYCFTVTTVLHVSCCCINFVIVFFFTWAVVLHIVDILKVCWLLALCWALCSRLISLVPVHVFDACLCR